MMRKSAFATYLRAQIKQRGWSQKRLADEADIPETTLSKWFKFPDRIPDLEAIVKISDALGVAPRVLLEVLGVDIEPPSTLEDQQRRIAHLVAIDPRLEKAVNALLELSAEDQAVGLAYLEGLAAQSRTEKT
jgi:transcriptional regulator with XRE-family HTH domain